MDYPIEVYFRFDGDDRGEIAATIWARTTTGQTHRGMPVKGARR